MRYELFIAFRHLRNRGRDFLSTITIIAIIGVFLGVMALTSVVAITGGFEEAFRDRVLGINSHMLIIKFGIDFRDYREMQKKVESIEGVKATNPFILHEMIASHEKKTAGVLIKGVDTKNIHNVSDIPKYLPDPSVMEMLPFDRFPTDGKQATPNIVLGKSLAEKLQLKVGDFMSVTSPLESLDPERWSRKEHRPSTNRFKVVGIFSCGFHEYDSRLVIVDYRALQDFFNQGDMITGLDVRVDDVFEIAPISRAAKEVLPPGRFRILDWRELNHNLFTSLGLQRLVLAVLFCFIVIVASFNIVCILIMIVLDKQKEIAILKSMGAGRRGIMFVFLAEGLVIGAVGTLTGLVGGYLVATMVKHIDVGLDPEIYMIDYLPVRIVPMEFLIIGLVATFISFLATIGPSWWASKWSPVDGLRYD